MEHRQQAHLQRLCTDPKWAAQKIVDQQSEIRALKRQNSRFMDAASHMFLFGCQCGPDGPEQDDLCVSCTQLTEAVMATPGDYEFEMLMWADHSRQRDREWREDQRNADREFLDDDGDYGDEE